MNEQEYIGKEIIETEDGLTIDNDIIMWKYEDPIITEGVRLLCDKINPKSVIELGFGYGFTSQQFQDCGVERHIIIEAHPELYQRALEWAEDKPGVEVINDFWQNVDIEDEVDLVYFDTFEMVYKHNDLTYSEEQEHFNFKWYATMFVQSHCECLKNDNWIEFEVNGEIYFQPLYNIGE